MSNWQQRRAQARSAAKHAANETKPQPLPKSADDTLRDLIVAAGPTIRAVVERHEAEGTSRAQLVVIVAAHGCPVWYGLPGHGATLDNGARVAVFPKRRALSLMSSFEPRIAAHLTKPPSESRDVWVVASAPWKGDVAWQAIPFHWSDLPVDAVAPSRDEVMVQARSSRAFALSILRVAMMRVEAMTIAGGAKVLREAEDPGQCFAILANVADEHANAGDSNAAEDAANFRDLQGIAERHRISWEDLDAAPEPDDATRAVVFVGFGLNAPGGLS